MSQALATGVYSLLTASQGAGTFYADLSGRIYEGVAPEEAALPLLTYMIVTDPPYETFGSDDIDARIEMDLYGERRLGAKVLGDIAAKVVTALQGASVTISGHAGGVLMFTERGRRTIDGDAHRITMEAIVQANQ
jgi:hypothetical protein